jgi:hypothetical protein
MNNRRKFQLENTWYLVAILLGMLLMTHCSNGNSSITPIAELPTPIVGMLVAPDELLPGEEKHIRVDSVVVPDENILPLYTWTIEKGEMKGQGTDSITYKAPETPGIYEIRLIVKYGNWETERATSIVVPTPILNPTTTNVPTPTITPTSTETPTSASVPTFTPIPTGTPTPTLTPTPTPTPTVTPTKPPTKTPTPTVSPSPTPYPAPALAGPENGKEVNGTFPPMDWLWDKPLNENEYFEVRAWHENITDYHPALGWVKIPHFDYNLTQELKGKYYWTVLVVEGKDAKPKDWWNPLYFPYPVWDGKLVRELSPESEIRFFFYTPPPDICKNCPNPGPISKPCKEPPCPH